MAPNQRGAQFVVLARFSTDHRLDMAGKRVGVVGGTTNERVMGEIESRRKLGLAIVPMKTREEAIAALEEGKVDAFASDKILLIGAASKAKDPKSLVLLPEDLSFEPYAIALPRGDAGLRLAVNTALAHIYREGEIASIFSKWFGARRADVAHARHVRLRGAARVAARAGRRGPRPPGRSRWRGPGTSAPFVDDDLRTAAARADDAAFAFLALLDDLEGVGLHALLVDLGGDLGLDVVAGLACEGRRGGHRENAGEQDGTGAFRYSLKESLPLAYPPPPPRANPAFAAPGPSPAHAAVVGLGQPLGEAGVAPSSDDLHPDPPVAAHAHHDGPSPTRACPGPCPWPVGGGEGEPRVLDRAHRRHATAPASDRPGPARRQRIRPGRAPGRSSRRGAVTGSFFASFVGAGMARGRNCPL